MHKKHQALHERASHYFDSFTDITMHNIKLYYLHVLRYMNEEDFSDVKVLLPHTKKFNTNMQGDSLRRVQSVQQTQKVSAEGMKRLSSDSTLENRNDFIISAFATLWGPRGPLSSFFLLLERFEKNYNRLLAHTLSYRFKRERKRRRWSREGNSSET